MSLRAVRLNLLAWFISHGIVFFSHNKSTVAGLSATKTISFLDLDGMTDILHKRALALK